MNKFWILATIIVVAASYIGSYLCFDAGDNKFSRFISIITRDADYYCYWKG